MFLLVRLTFPWHSRKLPASHTPGEPSDLQNTYWGKDISLFLLWNLAVISKLGVTQKTLNNQAAHYISQIITMSNSQCSTTGWPVLQILFKGLEVVLQLCETVFEFLWYSQVVILSCIFPFCTLQVRLYLFLLSSPLILFCLCCSSAQGRVCFYKPCTQEALSICMHGARKKHISAEEESEVGVRHFIF